MAASGSRSRIGGILLVHLERDLEVAGIREPFAGDGGNDDGDEDREQDRDDLDDQRREEDRRGSAAGRRAPCRAGRACGSSSVAFRVQELQIDVLERRLLGRHRFDAGAGLDQAADDDPASSRDVSVDPDQTATCRRRVTSVQPGRAQTRGKRCRPAGQHDAHPRREEPGTQRRRCVDSDEPSCGAQRRDRRRARLRRGCVCRAGPSGPGRAAAAPDRGHHARSPGRGPTSARRA